MAFQTPPTFVDGNVLSASQLNILATNQNYLAGAENEVNVGFREFSLSGSGTEQYVSCVHTGDFLYIRTWHSDDDCAVKIFYGAVEVGEVKTSNAAGGEGTPVSFDVSGLGIPKGAWVRWRLRGAQEGGTNGTSTVRFFAETADALG